MSLRTRLLALSFLVVALPGVALAERHQNRWWNDRPSWNFDRHSRGSDHDRGCDSGRYTGRAFSRADNAIDWGVRNGALSRAEEHELRDKQNDLERDLTRYRSDGYLSRDERAELRGDYNDFQHDISHELNDGERRARRVHTYRGW